MSEPNDKSPKASSGTTSGDAGQKQLQADFDKANEQGFFGTEVDPTPNENYTLQGGPASEGTPETDPKAAAKAREALSKVSGGNE